MPVAQLGESEKEICTKCTYFPTSALPWMARLGFNRALRLRHGWQLMKLQLCARSSVG